MPAWPLALVVLPAGFAVAEATGLRGAGGLVMVALAVAVLLLARARVGAGAAWCAAALAAFVGSHVLADVAGAWGAVAIAAAAVSVAAWALLDRCATRRGARADARRRTAAGPASS